MSEQTRTPHHQQVVGRSMSGYAEFPVADLPVACIDLDPRGTIQQMNRRAQEMFAHPVPMSSLMEVVRLEDTEMLRSFLSGESVSDVMVVGFRRPDGPWWGELRVQRARRSDGTGTLRCVVLDVTARLHAEESLRRSEADLRRILEMTPDATLFLRDGVITYANFCAHRLLQLPTDALEGRPLGALLREEECATVLRWLNEDRHLPDQSMEFSLCGAGGAQLRVEGQAMRATYEGQPVVLLSCRDLTERRRIEARIAQADRLASLGVLVAGIAHEINNPLTAIHSSLAMMFAEMSGHQELGRLPSRSLVEQWQMLTGIAQNSVDRVARIVKDLRTISKEKLVEHAPVLVNTVAHQTLKMLEPNLFGRVTLTQDLQAVPPVIGDADRLGQVVLNLLLNACEAMPPRPIEHNHVLVRTAVVGDEVCVEVHDNGVGIPAEHLSRLFTPFFTTRRQTGGTGLGLTVCHGIIQQMSGRIEVESAPGEGARFRVFLPQAPEDSVSPSSPQRVVPTRTSPQLERILLVDNEPLLRASLSRLLEYYGEVIVASSGNGAIALLESDSDFDLILSDILMPDGDGIALLQWVQQNQPEMLERLVFMTGMLTASSHDALNRAGCTILEKPIAFAEVEATIERLYGEIADPMSQRA
ncbi:MAG: ATP-binding protein [Myxococcota bacterium]